MQGADGWCDDGTVVQVLCSDVRTMVWSDVRTVGRRYASTDERSCVRLSVGHLLIPSVKKFWKHGTQSHPNTNSPKNKNMVKPIFLESQKIKIRSCLKFLEGKKFRYTVLTSTPKKLEISVNGDLVCCDLRSRRTRNEQPSFNRATIDSNERSLLRRV